MLFREGGVNGYIERVLRNILIFKKMNTGSTSRKRTLKREREGVKLPTQPSVLNDNLTYKLD